MESEEEQDKRIKREMVLRERLMTPRHPRWQEFIAALDTATTKPEGHMERPPFYETRRVLTGFGFSDLDIEATLAWFRERYKTMRDDD